MVRTKLVYIIAAAIMFVALVLVGLLVVLASDWAVKGNDIVFLSASDEKIYDGTPLECHSFALVSGKLKSGHTASATFLAQRTNAGLSPNQFTVAITDKSGKDVSGSYNVRLEFGQLNVAPLPLSISTASAVKEYDGTPLFNDTYQVLFGQTLLGHTMSVVVVGQRTNAGISDNDFALEISDENGINVTANYHVERLLGKLQVLKREVVIATPSCERVYNGLPLTCKEFSYGSTKQVLSGHTIKVEVTGSITNAGIASNTVGGIAVTDDNGNDVTGNYNFVLNEGELLVRWISIAIRSASDSKIYDGSPLTNHNWEIVSQSKPLEGHIVETTISGIRTDIGQSNNFVAQIRVLNGASEDVSHNYQIKIQEGILSVLDPNNPSGGNPSNPALGAGLNESGNILSEGQPSENTVIGRIFSEVSGSVYLRYTSFGDYNGASWAQGEAYANLIDSKYSMNYLTSLALKNLKLESRKFSVESYTDNYLLPYYLDTDALMYSIQTNDVRHSGNTNSAYSGYYFAFDYSNQSLKLPQAYSQIEASYNEYVNLKYLQLPPSTKSALQQILANNNLLASNPDIVEQVRQFVLSCATYNLNYDRNLNNEPDIAVSFLSLYREGICQHFASAATLLYRALGIPARYVIGYAASTRAGEWANIYAQQAHAWVEVYISGAGWVQIDVTPPVSLSEGQEAGGKTALIIKPQDQFLKYSNGVILKAQDSIQGLDDLLKLGYTYTAVVSGMQNTVGISHSKIVSFSLFDKNGLNVTSNYDITYLTGKLQLYVKELSISTGSASKVYDGTALTGLSSELKIEGELLGGHSIFSKKLTAAQTDVGSGENSCEIVIRHNDGTDVTQMYYLVNHYGTLTVSARQITVTASSQISSISPLSCYDYTITSTENELPLAPLDKATVVITSVQIGIGRTENEIDSVIIINKNGKNVTKNYSITYVSGTLTVTR